MGVERGIPADDPFYGGTWRVRIRSAAGEVLGAGILLGSDTVLTCAHVIPDDGGVPPATPVLVDLVGVHDARPVSARVAEGCWVPQLPDSCGDVALLRLSEPQPAEHAAPLYRLPPLPGRPVSMFGFPEDNPSGLWFTARIIGTAGPRSEWVQLNGDVVRLGFSGAGVRDEVGRHIIGMIVSRYDDSSRVPSAERQRFSYMVPVETIVRHLPGVRRWVSGDRGVDPPLVSQLVGKVQDIGFAQRLALWLRRGGLAGREGIADVETVVIADGDSDRYEALSRAVTLADRELSGGHEEAVSAAPHGTVPPIGSLDLAIDVTGWSDTDVARRVADRMDLRADGDTSPLSRIQAGAVPLTIVAVGLDRAADQEALVRFMRVLADRGSRLMLVFRDPGAPGLRLAEELFRPDPARVDAWLEELAASVARAGEREREAAERGARFAELSGPRQDASGLRINLLRLRGDPELRSHRIVAKLAAFEHAVRTVGGRAEATLRAAAAQQAAVEELRGLLAAYAAMLGAMAASERAELFPLQRAAHALLDAVPCDVPEARRAVDRFVHAVHTPAGEPERTPEGGPS
ncbi:trypsin-like peptidase domain-containing protein [Streptomyces sp. 205]|uniref:Trypsin-like peptidase domain-containing protein n=2 Tax=Streptomyces coffeae TaxID=621382 RepID=A0ABS1NH95_9ACTN|nr:serine protease [Streptomyces coffeae]MBL1099453.1 trypsin-like peptidase domain-containing protein [Streptomyces coffeae]